MTPIITETQKHALQEDGFFVLDNVFTPNEMNALAVRIETLQKRHQAQIAAQGGREGISRADEITFTVLLAEQDEQIRAFATRPEFAAISTQLLGPDIDLYWNQSVFKMPEGRAEFPWHQDDGYTPVAPSPYLTLWLALNDATPENGCISVLPGSHKQGLVAHTPSPIGLSCYSADAADQGVRVPVQAGSLAVFLSLTMHKSGPNLSTGPRKAYVLQYSQAGLCRAETGEVFPDKIPVARNGKAAAQNSRADLPRV
jgi:phytanoyl-CoA hydroxylase